MNLFSNSAAADNGSTFEHKRLQSRLRKITRGNETVVAGTDDDYIKRHVEKFSIFDFRFSIFTLRLNSIDNRQSQIENALPYLFFQSLTSCSAALRPGAPMMPPPGCVAEPHM